MRRAICIHGHFYQPPRENPWLEEVEIQTSAHPIHDWNERLTRDCYLPNSSARIFNKLGHITDIIDNYSHISFNMGPTLLQWMYKNNKVAYEAIIEADKKSVTQHDVGSAIAQCYNHMIMPLANDRDRLTQVIWGIKDFEFRFGRKPLGMWAPETAINYATLESMAACGIEFTILAPHQAKRVKKIEDAKWFTPSEEDLSLDSPYLCRLPSGKSIAIFFYNGAISAEIGFGDLLTDGEYFASSLLAGFRADAETQLVSVATDGETFGHHKRFGDMALAACLKFLQSHNHKVTTYSQYLKSVIFEHEVEINDNTSWSCAHGVGRWKEDCSCNTGEFPKGNQKWRKPLREALDFLRDSVIPIYEKKTASLFKDPWQTRDDYIAVILDRSQKNVESFLADHALSDLSLEQKTEALRMLEMQRHAMLMFTSCGWFFDDIGRIEAVQILFYAKRVLQLAEKDGLEDAFLKILAGAISNRRELGNGADIYNTQVKPFMIDLEFIAANFAISSMFKNYPKKVSFFCYEIEVLFFDKLDFSLFKYVCGQIKIRSNITWEEKIVSFLGLNLENYRLVSHICTEDPNKFPLYQQIKELFKSKSFDKIAKMLAVPSCGKVYTIWDLLKDERASILDILLYTTTDEVKSSLIKIINDHYFIIEDIKNHSYPLPDILERCLEGHFAAQFLDLLSKEPFELEPFKKLTHEATNWKIKIATPVVNFQSEEKLINLIYVWKSKPEDLSIMTTLKTYLEITLSDLKISMDLWSAQNQCFSMKNTYLETMKQNKPWITTCTEICKLLKIEI